MGALTALGLTRRRFGPVHPGRLALFVLLVVVAALPGSLAALSLTLVFPEIALTSSAGALLVVVVGTVVATLSYVGLAWVLRVAPVRDGLHQARELLAARLGRR